MKNKEFLLKALALLLICLMGLISLSGCTEQNETESTEEESEEEFEPAKDSGEDSELSIKYEENKENSELAFKNSPTAPKEAFSYEVSDGKVKIVKYTADESVVVIPETIDGAYVTEIAKGAFSGGGIRAVYVPDSVKKIEESAFDNCDGLSTLRLPFIGDGAENAFLGYIFGADEPDENAVTIPPSLKMVIVGDGCEEIADRAFKGAKTLSTVVLSDTVKKIGTLAFYQCTDLVYVDIGGASEIGEYAFGYCKSLYSIDMSGADKVDDGALYYCSALNSLAINFDENDLLGRIFGADSADYNGEFVPTSLRTVNVAEGCKKIPDRAFSSCKYITEVNLPESLESVGIRAFYSCRSLSSIEIPDKVKKIGDDAFFGCDNMTSLKLGASLEIIGMQAFYGCKALKSVECPKSLKEIQASAFYGCSSLEKVSLGGVRRIGKDAFSACPRLPALNTDGIEVEK